MIVTGSSVQAPTLDNTRIDQWSHILNGRQRVGTLKWLYPLDTRRIQAYCILDWYEAAQSDKAIQSLPDSYVRNWVDSGVVAYLGGKFAELTMTGVKLQFPEKEEANAELDKWVSESELDSVLHQIERNASIYGDAVGRVAWDFERMIPVIEDRHPGMYYSDGAAAKSVVLIAHSAMDPDYLDVEHYSVRDGKVYMLTGIIKASDTTALNNERSLYDRIASMPETVLGCSSLPLVHVLNRKGADDRWGESDFSRVLSLVDSWHKSACTDARIISERMASPSRFISGEKDPTISTTPDGRRVVNQKYEPGVMYHLGQNGTVTQLDNSTALDLLIKYDAGTWDKILKLIGLTRAGIGETGDTGNLREFQVKLMYGPTDQTVRRRRRRLVPRIKLMLKVARELWQTQDPGGYNKRFGTAKLEDAVIGFGSIMPEDMEGRMNLLATARAGGGLPRRYYVGEVLNTMGVEGNVDEAITMLEEEDRRMPGLSGLSGLDGEDEE